MEFDILLQRLRNEPTNVQPLLDGLSSSVIEVPSLRVDDLADALCSAVEASGGSVASWELVEKLLKTHIVSGASAAAGPQQQQQLQISPFLQAMGGRIADLSKDFGYAAMQPMEFRRFQESFKLLFGQEIGAIIQLKMKAAAMALKSQQQMKANSSSSSSSSAAAAAAVAPPSATGGRPPPAPGFSALPASSSVNQQDQQKIFSGNIEFKTPENPSSSGTGALVVHRGVRAVGGFSIQNANNKREMGHAGALMVKTRDSAQAMRSAALYAPAAPAEIALQNVPKRDADAPIGYMTVEAASREQVIEHVAQRKDKLKGMFKRLREQREAADADGEVTGTERNPLRGEEGNFEPPSAFGQQQQHGGGDDHAHSASSTALASSLFTDIRMPLVFPRDDYGVKIGYFPEGVRFLRDIIRDCGGAVPLILLEQRVGGLTDESVRNNFGDLRQFLSIHTPTFHISDEDDDQGNRLWIVRLADDVDRVKQDGGTVADLGRSWLEMICPHCSRVMPGRNFARHENSRKCVGVQISLGGLGRTSSISPIMNMAFAAREIMMKPKAEVDDDDIDYFADMVEAAAKIDRFRHASERHFMPMLKTLRVLRDRFLAAHNAATFDAVTLTETDGVFAKLFRIWGENVLRLPIPWIDVGDVVDMCRRFTKTVKAPPLPAPRPGDPRIQPGNNFAGFLMAESGTDVDDQPSEPDDELSDDEAPVFAFAPPVTPMETVMAAGNERDTKRLTYRLHTAPPIKAKQIITGTDGTTTLQQASAHFNSK